MTLQELCKHFKSNQSDSDLCEYYKNEYMLENKDKYSYEVIDESDIKGLRPYLMCWILAIYEYLAHYNDVDAAEWSKRYSDVACDKDENDYYLELVKTYRLINSDAKDESIDEIFNSMLENAIPEFKKRNIPLHVMYNIA